MAASQTLKGYLDEKGKFQIPEQFADARDFSEGLAAVSKNDLYGFIDPWGKTVIGFRFSDVDNFSGGLAPAADKDGLWGYINRRGEWVIPPRYDRAYGFDGGMAEVEQDKKYFFIDKGGSRCFQEPTRIFTTFRKAWRRPRPGAFGVSSTGRANG
jgi:hypothetical protein